MQFSIVAAAVVAVLAPLVAAQSNPIVYPDATAPLVAGEITTIKWTPSTEGSIELKLKKGPSGDLDDVFTIIIDDANTGTYDWMVPADLPAGENYAISITSSDEYINYTPLLCIESEVPEVKTTASASASSTKTASADKDEETKTASEKEETKTASDKEDEETKTASDKEEETEAASTTDKEDEETKPAATIVSTSIGTNGTVISVKTLTGKNATATKSANSSASLPKPTSANDDEDEAQSDSSAMAVVRSPLALVACLIGAVVYLG